MKQFLFVLLNIVIINNVSAQGLTKNGGITSTGTSYVSINGAIGASAGVNKNGQIVASLSVGSDYQGGKIFYLFVSGDPGYVAGETHGLIAATADIGGGRKAWGCGDYGGDGIADVFVTGTQSGIGYGNQNTITIVTTCTTVGIAAQLCNDLTLNGYSDWYLPSKDELTKLYQNRASIGGFQAFPYWSSTQGGGDQYYALGRWFDNSNLSGAYNRTNTYWVRPVRTF